MGDETLGGEALLWGGNALDFSLMGKAEVGFSERRDCFGGHGQLAWREWRLCDNEGQLDRG